MTQDTYKLRNGKCIIVGTQDFIKGVVPVTVDNKTVECEMGQGFAGDLGFCCEGQFVYFRDL